MDIFESMGIEVERKKISENILNALLNNEIIFEEAEFKIQNLMITGLIKQLRTLPENYKLFKVYKKKEWKSRYGREILKRGIIIPKKELAAKIQNNDSLFVIELSEEIKFIQNKNKITEKEKYLLLIYFYNYIKNICKISE